MTILCIEVLKQAYIDLPLTMTGWQKKDGVYIW